MRVRPWEAALAGTASLAVFAMAWVGAFHVATPDDGPRDIFGSAAVLADEAPPLAEPPAFVLGATVERTRQASITNATTTPGPAPTTTAPAPTSTTTTTAPPPEPPPEEPSEPTSVIDTTVDVVGGVVSGILSLL